MRRIVLASGKGGVGRTTLVANVGIALAKMGKSTVLVDASLTTPNLGPLFKLEKVPYTLNDVLAGEIPLSDAIYSGPHGLRIAPASVVLEHAKKVNPFKLPHVLSTLDARVDFLIIDAPGGLRKETVAALRAGEEVVLVTLPETTSISNMMRTRVMAEFLGFTPTGIIVNRVLGEEFEFPSAEVKRLLNLPLLGEIPEDINVRKAWRRGEPVLEAYPKSSASKAIMKLAEKLVKSG